MTVSTTNNRKLYAGLTGQDTFAYDYRVDVKGDMEVYLDGVLEPDGNWTITGLENPAGGNVVLNTPLVVDASVTLLRNVDLTQATDYQPLDAFPAETHESALDKLTFICQQLQEQLDRVPLLSVDTGLTGFDLGSPAAEELVMYNAAEDGFEATGKTLVAFNADVTAAATSASNAATSETNAANSAAAALASQTAAAASAASLTGFKLFAGLDTAQDTDSEHDVLINPGRCIDRGAADTVMVLASILTKQIDADWAEGDDAGGLASGARSVANTPNASTWYHYFLISDSTGLVVDAGWDTSLDASNLLADAAADGYTKYQLVISHYVNASNNIDDYLQFDDRVVWDVSLIDYNGGSTNGETLVTCRVPSGYVVEAEVIFQGDYGGSAFNTTIYTPGQTLPVSSSNKFTVRISGSAAFNAVQLFIPTNTSGQVAHESDNGGQNLDIITRGWRFKRGSI